MCGIGGIVNTNNSKIDPNIIENIKDSLEHRGPDNSSVKHNSETNCFELCDILRFLRRRGERLRHLASHGKNSITE